MKSPVAVKKVEQRARRALRQDGLAIILAGIAFAIMAPFFLDDRLGFLLILGTGLYVFLPEILRQRFVYPRIGYVKFKEKKAKPWKLFISTILLVLFVVVLKLNAYTWLLPLYLGVVFGVIAFAIGCWYKTAIEYIISAFMFVSGVVGIIATTRGNDPGIVAAVQLWGLAAILIPIGLFRLIRFLRKYPIPRENAASSEVSNATSH